MSIVDLKNCHILLHNQFCDEWKIETQNKPKLRTYVQFKESYNVEQYVLSFMNRGHRSYLAQLRCGILPLEIETGQWYNISAENRVCKVCKTNSVENEINFIFHCNLYHEKIFYQKVQNVIPTFLQVNYHEKLKILISDNIVNIFAKYLCDIVKIRQSILYK